MSQHQTTTPEARDVRDTRKVISAFEFDKKLDEEFAYLTWQQYVPADEARVEARRVVESQYIRRQVNKD